MKKQTLETWLLQLDAMIAKLDEAERLDSLGSQEKWALGLLKDAVVSFETAIEEQERGIRIPPGYSVSSALNPKI